MAMQPSGKKSNFAGGKWKSTTQDRPAPPAPKPVEVAPPSPPRSLAERLPAMTDVQLLALQANAGYQMNAQGQPGTNGVTVLSRAKINF